ncbi:MAG: copper-binding protein [Vicinamibacterales bacterium]|nr:copper-binding protein [Vicinamibacterales bacterium]
MMAVSCGTDAPIPDEGQRFTARPGALRFPITGCVVSVDVDAQDIVLAHDEIAGFMNAMTMTLGVKETVVLTALAPGHAVSGTLVVDGARLWIEDTKIDEDGRCRAVFDRASPTRGQTFSRHLARR